MSEVITNNKEKLQKAIAALNSLEDGEVVCGELSFYKSGYGKTTGAWKGQWIKPIEFRLKRTSSNDILEYRTDTTGWTNEKYGSPFELLIGKNFQYRAKKWKLINLKLQEDKLDTKGVK